MAELTRIQVIEILNGGASLRGVDLSGLDLSGLDFSRANFAGADLSKCKLVGCEWGDDPFGMVSADVGTARQKELAPRLAGARCTGADFSNATFGSKPAEDLRIILKMAKADNTDAIYTDKKSREEWLQANRASLDAKYREENKAATKALREAGSTPSPSYLD
jgi:uncharacterized protein YjbI with pentapeptide repeats